MSGQAVAAQTHADATQLNHLIAGLGYEIVDIAGFLDTVLETAHAQLQTLDECQGGLRSLTDSSDAVMATAAKMAETSQDALQAVEQSVETMRATSEVSRSVSGWVTEFGGRIASVEVSLSNVQAANIEITNIATQVNILAINAGIEAARAGDAGRGFAIVAGAIKELSRNTSQAAKDVAEHIRSLSETVQTLKKEAQVVSQDAEGVIAQSSSTDAALVKIAGSIKQTSHATQDIATQAESVDRAGKLFAPAFQKMSHLAKETGQGVTQASARGSALIERSEAIVQEAASLDSESVDTPFIFYVQDAADRIRDLWETAMSQGRITMADLFDTHYVPIPGTDPQQFKTRFTDFTDATLPAIQEAALTFDPKVVFCAAVDRSGYLPTHNKKFARPQSADPVWNASNCRNRRIFDDRVGLKSGRNQKPFLLQVYRRDMGGGQFTMMKDLSSPIVINGRHWGGLRMAYTFD